MPEIAHRIWSYLGWPAFYPPESSSYELLMAEDGDILTFIIKFSKSSDKSLNAPNEDLKRLSMRIENGIGIGAIRKGRLTHRPVNFNERLAVFGCRLLL